MNSVLSFILRVFTVAKALVSLIHDCINLINLDCLSGGGSIYNLRSSAN